MQARLGILACMAARRTSERWDPSEFIGRFLVIDDDAKYAEHIGAFMRERRPVDFARSIAEAERRLAGPTPYIGLVIDLVLPDGNGVAYLDTLRARGERAPAILLAAADELAHIVHVRVGALCARILHKEDEVRAHDDFETLVARFRELALEHEARSLGPRAALFDLSDGELTPTEMRVAELRLAGDTNAQVAEGLGITAKTVKNHVSSVLAKCGGTGRGLGWLRDRVEGRAHGRRLAAF